MADLEEHAFRRDRRFVVRLVLVLSVATLGGLFVYTQLTSRRTAGCAADVLTGEEPPGTTGAPRSPHRSDSKTE